MGILRMAEDWDHDGAISQYGDELSASARKLHLYNVEYDTCYMFINISHS